MIDLSVTLGRLRLRNPILVASGTFGYAREMAGVVDFARLGGVIPKTVTRQARSGNAPPRTVETACGMLNAIGLDNDGIEHFLGHHVPYLRTLPTAVIANVAGKNEGEFVEMAAMLAGGGGLAAVELGKVLGARVIAAASSDEKLAACRERGAVEVINYSTQDLRERIRSLTDSNGVDVVYDPVGGAYAEPALRSTAWGGRYLVVGFAAGEIPRIPLNLPLLKGCAVVGVFWGSFTAREPQRNAENLRQLVAWLADGTIRPLISATYPLADVARALNDLLERKAAGKVVLVIDG